MTPSTNPASSPTVNPLLLSRTAATSPSISASTTAAAAPLVPSARMRPRGRWDFPLALLPPGRVRPSTLRHRPTQSSGGSDFARDGYTAGKGGGLVRNPSSASSSTSYSTSSSNSSYAPPPPRPTPSKANRIEEGGRDSGVDDEELRPTTVPTPGCPLLKDRKPLVYSVGFWCPKCMFIRSSSTSFFSMYLSCPSFMLCYVVRVVRSLFLVSLLSPPLFSFYAAIITIMVTTKSTNVSAPTPHPPRICI
jgi:hypothetical protein